MWILRRLYSRVAGKRSQRQDRANHRNGTQRSTFITITEVMGNYNKAHPRA
jgi:hypothetical protein